MRHVASFGLTLVVLATAVGTAGAADCAMLSAGAAYGSPGKLSAFVEGGCALREKSTFGFVVGGQAGLGGGELTAGVGRRAGEMSSVNLRAVVARTWAGGQGAGGNSTLVGGRLEYSVLGRVLSLNGGVLVPVSGASRRSAQFTWGVGVGLPLWLRSWPGIGRIEV